MTKEVFLKFKNAMDAAGIKYYQATVDTSTNLYNSKSAVLVFDEDSESFLNLRGKIGTASDGYKDEMIAISAGIEDVHYVKFGCTKKQAYDFVEAYNANLTDEQKQVLININKGNYNIIPETGDYILAGFKVLSEEEIAELSPQQKIDYEEKLKIYNDRQKAKVPVITVDIG